MKYNKGDVFTCPKGTTYTVVQANRTKNRTRLMIERDSEFAVSFAVSSHKWTRDIQRLHLTSSKSKVTARMQDHMSGWSVIPQRKGALVYHVAFRPASPKEYASMVAKCKRDPTAPKPSWWLPLNPLTLRILIRHANLEGEFKLVAQHRQDKETGEYVWRLNLHDPDKNVPVDMWMKTRTTVVSLPHPTKTKTLSHSTGTTSYRCFFKYVFGDRVRDTAFRLMVQTLLDEKIVAIMKKKKKKGAK